MSYLMRNPYWNGVSLCKRLELSFFNIQSSIGVKTNLIYTSARPQTITPSPSLLLCKELDLQKRYYAKGKNKPKGGGKQSLSHISEDELSEVISLENFKQEMVTVIENLKEDFIKHLSIRTSLGGLESIQVELEGDKYPLAEIAQVIRKSPTLVVVNATAFPQASANIKKAIVDSGMNLNPQQDGTTIFIPVPKVTKEHREGLSQNAKTLCDKTKTQLKDIQNKFVKKTKAKDGKLSQDLIFNAQVKLREMTQERCVLADTMLKNKQGELLKVNK